MANEPLVFDSSTVRKISSAYAIVFPKELIEDCEMKPGDRVFVTKSDNTLVIKHLKDVSDQELAKLVRMGDGV